MGEYFICELSRTVSCTVLYIPYAQRETHGHHSFKNIIIIVSWPLYPAICIFLWEIVSIESSMQKNPLVPSW